MSETARKAPEPGAIEGGYRFLGGDASKPENWRSLQLETAQSLDHLRRLGVPPDVAVRIANGIGSRLHPPRKGGSSFVARSRVKEDGEGAGLPGAALSPPLAGGPILRSPDLLRDEKDRGGAIQSLRRANVRALTNEDEAKGLPLGAFFRAPNGSLKKVV